MPNSPSTPQNSDRPAPANLPEPTTTVFVYGTLKRGFELAPHLDGQHFIGHASTRQGFRLYSIDGDFPGLVEAPDGDPGHPVTGELWRVDARCLADLDDIEGVDEGYYERRPVPLAPPHDHLVAHAYYYLKPVSGFAEVGPTW